MHVQVIRVGRKRKQGKRWPSGDIRLEPKSEKWILADFWQALLRDPHAVYVIAGPSAVKIGRCDNPTIRLDSLQVGHAAKLTLIESFWMDKGDALRLEKGIHQALRCSNFHARGEWYLMGAKTAVDFVKREAETFGVKCWADSEWGHNRIREVANV